MVELLDDAELGAEAANQLSGTLLMFDAFHDVAAKAKAGNEECSYHSQVLGKRRMVYFSR